MSIIKCDKCGNVFNSKYCPDCGRNRDDIKVETPIEIVTYVHSDKEDGYSMCDEYSIDPESKLGKKLIYSNYEVKIIYKIDGDNLIAISANFGDGQGDCDIVPKNK